MSKPLDHLPDLGERIEVLCGDVWVPATVISMHECRARSPELWHPRGWKRDGSDWRNNNESRAYAPDDTIRAFVFEPSNGESPASFCIMGFFQPGRGRTYNNRVRLP